MASLEGIEKSVFSADGGPMRNVMLELSQEYVRKGQLISALAWNMALLSFYEVCVHEAKKQGGAMGSYIFQMMGEKGNECVRLASNCPPNYAELEHIYALITKAAQAAKPRAFRTMQFKPGKFVLGRNMEEKIEGQIYLHAKASHHGPSESDYASITEFDVSPIVWTLSKPLDEPLDLSSLKLCTNVEKIYLNDTGITVLPELPNPRKIKALFIDNNNDLSDISNIKLLENLEELELGHNYKLNTLTSLEKLKKLKRVDLTSCCKLKQEMVDALKNLLPECNIFYLDYPKEGEDFNRFHMWPKRPERMCYKV